MTGRFSQRPHFKPGELDRECESIMSGFLRERHGAAEYPVSTEDTTVLIEQHTESSIGSPIFRRTDVMSKDSRSFSRGGNRS
jgi:hypothetical protein